MQNDANSGWLYHLGDAIFGDVLLIDAEDLFSVISIYALNVRLGNKASFPVCISDYKISEYNCIIVNSTDSEFPDKKFISELVGLLKNNGLVAVVYNNETHYKKIISIEYPYLLVKKVLSIIKGAFIPKKKEGVSYHRYYMQSVHGKINEVFYNKGYQSVKNPFLLAEKAKKYMFGKICYQIFSSNIIDIIVKGNQPHKTIIKNVIDVVEAKTACQFGDILKCTIIPYKVLVSVSSKSGSDYIFLLLRGADRNVRANRELDMLNYLNDTYPELSSFFSKSVASGIYKNIEYIVYHKIPGVSIDSVFNGYHIAERAAFDMLLRIGKTSRKNIVFDSELYHKMTATWFSRLDRDDQSSDRFEKYLDRINCDLFENLQGKSCGLVLYHGDYKIENLIFNTSDYSVNGIIDWDLSEKHHFPGLDLLYLIIYSRRIKNKTSFIAECEEIFLREGFNSYERSMLKKYCECFNISDDLLSVIVVFFIIHHFACRERSGYTNIWLMLLLESVWNPDKTSTSGVNNPGILQ